MLKDVLDAVLGSSERALRLIVNGESVAPGKRPAWLTGALDYTVTGLSAGSTILEIEAPPLRKSLGEQLDQGDFWLDQPAPDDTALDVLSDALTEITASAEAGDRYDAGVLGSLMAFRSVVREDGGEVELRPLDRSHRGFRLDHAGLERVQALRRTMPANRSFAVSGYFNAIEHSKRKFRLDLTEGRSLQGTINQDHLDVETMREYWGKKVTVNGTVHFKANGQPRLLEADVIKPMEKGEEMFERLPVYHVSTELFPEFAAKEAAGNRVMELWGAWPGEETVEELLAALDD